MAELNPRDMEGRDLSDRLRIQVARAVGVYGFVYEGELLSLGRPIGKCAIKLVRTHERYPAEGFLQDVRDQAKWSHERLLNIHTSGQIKNGPGAGWIYLAMELGEFSLQEVLDRGDRMPQRDVHEMLLHISEALTYLHENGVSHGEIRPSNIIYTNNGWKLSGLEYRGSFGRRLEEVAPNENNFVFRAPEVLQNLPESLPVDLWSFGVLTHAALTSRLPFQETSELTKGDLMWRITHREPEPEALGPPFDELMGGCLKRAPLERWSASKVNQCLRGEAEGVTPEAAAVASTQAVPVVRPQEPTRPARAPSKGPPLWAVIPVCLLAVGVVVGLKSTPRPVKMRPNVLSGQLSTRNFQIAKLDVRGRVTKLPAQAPILKEDLGQGVSLELIQIPAGEFDMGSPPSEARRETDEGPQHRVRIDAFYMARCEISQSQWARVAELPPVQVALPLEPSKHPGALLPVQGISYPEAVEFCARLSQKTGRFYRLPTESEWEYACRGGPSTEPFHFGPTITSEVATYRASRTYIEAASPGRDATQPSPINKHSLCNPFGLLDMHGNVKEWCYDYYAPYSEKRAFNPSGPEQGQDRVVRGGGFSAYPWKCRSAARAHLPPQEQPFDVGLRVVAPESVPDR